MFAGQLGLSISRSVRSNLMNIRQMSTAINTDCVKSLLYKEYGDPVEVLQVTTQTIEQPVGNQVIIAIKVYLFSSTTFSLYNSIFIM